MCVGENEASKIFDFGCHKSVAGGCLVENKQGAEMKKHGRKAIVEKADPMTEEDLEQARKEVLCASVSAATLKQYRARMQILRRFAKDTTGEEELGKKHWFAFCLQFASKSRAAGKSALEGYRAAVAFAQRLGEMPGVWAKDDDVVAAMTAVCYRGGERKRPSVRGAMTREMLVELLTWLRSTGQGEMVEVVTVIFGVHGRIEEVMGLKKEDVSDDGIEIPDKVFRAANVSTESPRIVKKKEVITDEAWSILTRRASETESGRLIFPCQETRTHRIRAAMHRAARELGWDEEVLVFDVPHCLRHGRVMELVAEGREGEIKMSKSGIVRYGMPNEGREGDREVRAEFRRGRKK
jgi:hypothetical protein